MKMVIFPQVTDPPDVLFHIVFVLKRRKLFLKNVISIVFCFLLWKSDDINIIIL